MLLTGRPHVRGAAGRMLVTMTRRSLGRLTRSVDAPLLLESFLIAAVASFLGIRAFLALTGYPRIGSNGIHVAHMLWGGLLMLVALMLLVAFLDRWVHHLAAIIAGLGFGTFIDEIGKFVTADNDYFFRPAVALVYGLFIIAFLGTRVLIGRRPLSESEALANSLSLLAGTRDEGIEPEDRMRIHGILDLADPASARRRLAEQYLAAVPGVPDQQSLIESVHRRLADDYADLMANPFAERALIVGVVAYAAIVVIGVVLLATSSPNRGAAETSTVATTVQVISTIVGAAFVVRGLISLPSSRMAAFQWFVRGLLVWMLITQMFVFYTSQLAGIGGLVVDLVAYGSLRFAITHEIAGGRGPVEAASRME